MVEWSGGASMIRLMTSDVSALSGIVANGHQAIHLVSSAPSVHSVRWVFPSTAGSQPCRRASFRNPSRLRLTRGLRFTRFWPFRIQASGTAAAPTGPWLSTVYHPRPCKRSYGPIRQPDELRPAWLLRLLWSVFAPSGAVRLAFPSFPCHAFCVHAATPTPPTGRFPLMVHPPAMRAFVHSVGTRLFRTFLSLASERGHYRGGSFLVMLRPARWLGRLASPRWTPFQNPTGSPVYGRACSSRGLPPPKSAITTRPNHLLPRRDSHPLACQRPKAAHRIMAGQNHTERKDQGQSSMILSGHDPVASGCVFASTAVPKRRSGAAAPDASRVQRRWLRGRFRVRNSFRLIQGS